MKLLFVILSEKHPKAEICVEDKNGRRRVVTVIWRTKEFTPIPEGWLQMVEAELANQDSEEHAKSIGRKLFR
jgi:hypothetical protein